MARRTHSGSAPSAAGRCASSERRTGGNGSGRLSESRLASSKRTQATLGRGVESGQASPWLPVGGLASAAPGPGQHDEAAQVPRVEQARHRAARLEIGAERPSPGRDPAPTSSSPRPRPARKRAWVRRDRATSRPAMRAARSSAVRSTCAVMSGPPDRREGIVGHGDARGRSAASRPCVAVRRARPRRARSR